MANRIKRNQAGVAVVKLQRSGFVPPQGVAAALEQGAGGAIAAAWHQGSPANGVSPAQNHTSGAPTSMAQTLLANLAASSNLWERRAAMPAEQRAALPAMMPLPTKPRTLVQFATGPPLPEEATAPAIVEYVTQTHVEQIVAASTANAMGHFTAKVLPGVVAKAVGEYMDTLLPSLYAEMASKQDLAAAKSETITAVTEVLAANFKPAGPIPSSAPLGDGAGAAATSDDGAAASAIPSSAPADAAGGVCIIFP